MTKTFEDIQVAVDGSLCVITINRPKVLNALNARVIAELSAAFTELRSNEAVRAVILRGLELLMVYSSNVGDYKFPGGGVKYSG